MKSLEQTVRGINAARSNRSFYPIIRTFKKTASFEYQSFLLPVFGSVFVGTPSNAHDVKISERKQNLFAFFIKDRNFRDPKLFIYFFFLIYVVSRELFSQIHFYIKIILSRLNKLRTNSYQLIKISSFIRFETS